MSNIDRYEITSKRLQDAINNAGINQQQLSDMSEVSKASISQYINGKNTPSSISAVKLSKVLNVNPEWLMGFDVPARTVPAYVPEIQQFIGILQNLEKEQINYLLQTARLLEYQNKFGKNPEQTDIDNE